MNINSLIESDDLARFASCLTLASREITEDIETLISRRTVRRIDLDPMLRSKTTASSDMRLYASQKTLGSGIRAVATSPITKTVFVDRANVIQKRMRMSPTMTSFVFSHYVK